MVIVVYMRVVCVIRVKELGPGEVEEKPMTMDDHDDSSLAQQNNALAMLRTGNVRCATHRAIVTVVVTTIVVSLSLSSSLCVHFTTYK